MKIDFHCHTKAVKPGEKKTRNINAKEFKENIKSAGVKIVAITNHNIFDKKQFDEFYAEVNNEFILLPGIEVDVTGIKNERGHVVIVYDDKDVENFYIKVLELLKNFSTDTSAIEMEELISFINELDCVVLVHYYKADALCEESIEYMKINMKNNFRLFYEPSNYRTLGIMINHKFRALKGSDISDWKDYSKQEFANIKLDIDSYKQLFKFLKKDESVIESLLNTQIKYNVDISYKKGKFENIELYDDVNVFFGSKGTGKSKCLEKIRKYFYENGKKIAFYTPSENEDKLEEKLKINSEEKQLLFYERDNCIPEFKKLNNWAENNVTQFNDYLKYIKSKEKNANKKKMKIIDIRKTFVENSAIEDIKKDFNNVSNIKKMLESVQVSSYMGSLNSNILKCLIEQLLEKVKDSYANEFANKMSIRLTKDTIIKLKAIVDKKTETKSIPTETGFIEFAKKHFELELGMIKIFDGFDFKYESEFEYIGKLDEGKELYKKTVVKMIDKNCKATDGFLKIQELKKIKSILKNIKDNVYKSELQEYISTFKEYYFEGMSLDYFIGISKKFFVNGKEYNPSTGEATMIVLNDALKDDSDVYILDEPEKSLGNNYVSDVLVNKINDLAKMKKVVVVATHNANIAVRTMPYRSILKVYDNGEYKTYIGNPYTNKLINIKNKDDYKYWKEESIRLLEGGKEAFEERNDIYGEENNRRKTNEE